MREVHKDTFKIIQESSSNVGLRWYRDKLYLIFIFQVPIKIPLNES